MESNVQHRRHTETNNAHTQPHDVRFNFEMEFVDAIVLISLVSVNFNPVIVSCVQLIWIFGHDINVRTRHDRH